MWSRKILDTIVVEYSRSKCYAEYSTIIHRYSPFTDRHTVEPYSTHITWFTDNFPNMQGYPFSYVFIYRPPYSDFKLTLTGVEIKGVDKILSETLANKMNFTGIFKILPRSTSIFNLMPNNTVYGIIPDVIAGKYDALLTLMPRVKNVFKFRLHHQFTYPVLIENWCIVAPKLVKKNFNNDAMIKLFLIIFSIVGIFWLCSRLMKFNLNRWHPLKIIGMMLAMSLPTVPIPFRERLIYLSVLIVYACYSPVFFTELTSTNLISNHYVQFNSLQDVIDSDLVIMMHPLNVNTTRRYNSDFEEQFRKSDNKILTYTDWSMCFKDLLIHRNATCHIHDTFAKLAAVNNMQNGETTLIITKLCYQSPRAAYMFPKESPYVKRISNIILMLVETGLYDKWYRDYLRNETRESTSQINGQQTDFMYVSIFTSLIYILITGYSISALVFIGELIWKDLEHNLNLC
ncbi:uncharacterized protein [Linepithema humile]|uniref:uncharacterized protein n=1 Tax=Linepithema humile TaxID=83485 RepID=UPI00351DCBC6